MLADALGPLAAHVTVEHLHDRPSTQSPTDTPLWHAIEALVAKVRPEATLLPRHHDRRHRRHVLPRRRQRGLRVRPAVAGDQLRGLLQPLPRQRRAHRRRVPPAHDAVLVRSVPFLPRVTGALADRTVVVTRAAEQASTLVERLRAGGATVVEVPTIAIADPADGGAALAAAVADLDGYDWVVLTSTNGAARYLGALAGRHVAARRRRRARARPMRCGPPASSPPSCPSASWPKGSSTSSRPARAASCCPRPRGPARCWPTGCGPPAGPSTPSSPTAPWSPTPPPCWSSGPGGPTPSPSPRARR